MTDIVERGPVELAEAKTPDEADLVRREVEALIAVVRKAPAKAIEVNWAPLLRLRLDAWRKWGELLGPAENRGPATVAAHDGSNRDDRYRARKLAFEVPDDAYFKYRARENNDKLTLAGALRLAPPPDHDDPPPPTGTYRAIVIDPPWPIKRIERSEQREHQPDALDYSTLKVWPDEDDPPGTWTIANPTDRPIPDLAASDGCHVYLWVTHRFLPTGFELFEHWGVKYECLMTWNKNVGITPFSFMYDTEHVLFGRVGALEVKRKGLRLSFSAPVVGHSVKPDVFYERVIEASPEPRLEMFTRREREGFVAWGNEVADAG